MLTGVKHPYLLISKDVEQMIGIWLCDLPNQKSGIL